MVGPFQSGFFMWGQLRSSRINCCLVKGVCSQCLSPWRQSTKRIQDHIILQSELSRLCFKFPELDRGPPATHSGKANEERNTQITTPPPYLSVPWLGRVKGTREGSSPCLWRQRFLRHFPHQAGRLRRSTQQKCSWETGWKKAGR